MWGPRADERRGGVTVSLAQHSLDDTVRDLTFNSLGALVVALFGQVHPSGVGETVRAAVFDAE